MTGRRTRLAAGPLLLLALALQPQPAAAQLSNFIDGLLGRKDEPKAEAPAAPEEAAPSAAGRKAAPKPAKDKTASADRTAKDKAPAKAAATAPAPKVAAVGSPSAAEDPQEASPEVVLQRANAYFNSFQTLTANFLQTGADGRKIGGKLSLAKPGRLRFEYDQPSPLEIVADGTSVAVRDRRLNTQDVYFLSQTPLKFLIRERIDLARDLTVTEVTNDPGGYRIALEDRSTLGGTSKIQLYFDAELRTLSQWRITDPQGYLTTVQLANLQKGKAVDGTLFFIDYGRPEDKAMLEKIRRGEASAQ